MVAGGNDEGLVQLARLLQLLQEQRQRPVHLHGGANIVLGGLAVGQGPDHLPVGGHRPVVGVGHVAADGQVVDVEGGVAVDIVVHAGLHHHGVQLRPQELAAFAHVQALEAGPKLMPVIAQVGMGGHTSVHIAVGVIAQYVIARPFQLLGQGEVGVEAHSLAVLLERHLAGALHGNGTAVLGIEAQQGLALAVGGAGEVEGGVVVVEHKALMGQLVEGWGELRVDDIAGKTLQHQLDYVVALKHTGILVLPGGRDAVEVLGQPFDLLVGAVLRQGGKVNVHHVGRGVDHRARVHNLRASRLSAAAGAGGAGIRDSDIAEIGVHVGLRREDLVLHVQPKHGQKPQLLHLIVNVGVHLIEPGRGQVPLPGQADHPQAQHMKNHTAAQHQAGKADVEPLKAHQPSAQDAHQDGGQEHNQDNGKLLQHGGNNHVGVVGEPVVGRGAQRAGAVISLQNGLGNHLHHEDQRNYHRQHSDKHAVDHRGPGQGQRGEKQSRRHAEHQVDRKIDQRRLHVDVQDQLQVDQQHREQQHPPHSPGHHRLVTAPGASPCPHSPSVISHWNRPPNQYHVLPIYFTHLYCRSQGIFL